MGARINRVSIRIGMLLVLFGTRSQGSEVLTVLPVFPLLTQVSLGYCLVYYMYYKYIANPT